MSMGWKQLFVLGSLSMFVPTVSSAAPLPTDSFRKEHVQVKQHLEHIHQMGGTMTRSDAVEQRKTATMIADFLAEHIGKHAAWEEKQLYPAVDKRTHGGTYPFTGTMRYEHRIVGRWIGELKTMAVAPQLDATDFARKTDRLLGLITAHFEEEEEVLLPVLDKSTTKKQLEKELGIGADHAPEG